MQGTDGVNTLWIVWVVLIPVFYLAGLALLPRQFKQEDAAKAGKQEIGGRNMWGVRGGSCIRIVGGAHGARKPSWEA